MSLCTIKDGSCRAKKCFKVLIEIKAANLSGLEQEQGRNRAGAKQEQGRSMRRAGAGQEQGRNKAGAELIRVEQSKAERGQKLDRRWAGDGNVQGKSLERAG